MKQIAYRPGAWQVVVEESGIVAVPADTDAARIRHLSDLLQAGTPALTEVIDVLADGSITALGSFAVALDGANGVRFAVRGPVQVRIAGNGQDERFSGSDVSTWSERFVAQSREFELVLDDSQADPEYPIRSGVVLAGAVRAGDVSEVSGADVSDHEPASGPVSADAAAEPQPSAPSQRLAPAYTAVPAFSAPVAPAPSGSAPGAATVSPSAPSTVESDDSGDADAENAAVSSEQAHPTLLPGDFTDPSAEEADEEVDALDDLFPEATVHVAPPLAPPPPAPVSPELGDHDGATVSVAEMRRRRGEAAPDAPTAVFPAVEAQQSAIIGRIRVSSGQVVELDRTIIIGRRPRATRASGNTLPHLVAVESPQQDISRSHLEVRPEGDSVVVIDLHTTNGSTLLRPGSDPLRLHPGEHTLVTGGDVVDLGDGITVAFEGLA